MKEFTGVCEAGTDILGRQIRIAVEDLFLGPAGGEEINHKLDRYPRPLHDRFTHKDLGVGGDPILPIHKYTIAKLELVSGIV